jgi:hypothetical protein
MRGCTSACDVLYALVAQCTEIDTVQQMFASTEQDGRDGQVQFVNEGSAQILPNCGYAATHPDVATGRSIPRLPQRGVNTVGDEPKHRAAFHRERRSRMMSQHEDRRVIRRLVTPPAFPAVIRPRASDGAEHVSTENPSADSAEAFRRNIVICARLAIFTPVHPLPGPRVEEPVKQFRTADSKGVL